MSYDKATMERLRQYRMKLGYAGEYLDDVQIAAFAASEVQRDREEAARACGPMSEGEHVMRDSMKEGAAGCPILGNVMLKVIECMDIAKTLDDLRATVARLQEELVAAKEGVSREFWIDSRSAEVAIAHAKEGCALYEREQAENNARGMKDRGVYRITITAERAGKDGTGT